jgi:hypothetical protein
MPRTSGGSKISMYADGNLQGAFAKFFANAEKKFDERADAMLVRLNELIMARTPVWEGDTLVNFRWSTRAPIFEHVEPKGQNIDPGNTNSMPLGAEPRRKANETRVRQSLASALKAKDPVDIFLTNSSESATDVEYGLLPTPASARSRGAVRLSIKEVLGSLR